MHNATENYGSKVWEEGATQSTVLEILSQQPDPVLKKLTIYKTY